MGKEIRMGDSVTFRRVNNSIRLYERITMNSVVVFTAIISMLYYFQRINMLIGIILLGLIVCSLLFKRCTHLDVKKRVVERKLMIFNIVLLTYSKQVVGDNFVVYYEAHSHVVNTIGQTIFYYVVLKNIDLSTEIVLIKLRSEKRAMELKGLIEEPELRTSRQ